MKRSGAVVGVFILAHSALAGGTGLVGTKLGGDFATPQPAAGVGFAALAQMLFALAIVGFLLKWVLPRIAGKMTKKLTASPEGGIRVEESAQFAGGNLYIVSARGKSLLISVAGANVATLAELPTPTTKPDPFEVALAEAQVRPPHSAAELEARAALDRLTQLTGGHAR